MESAHRQLFKRTRAIAAHECDIGRHQAELADHQEQISANSAKIDPVHVLLQLRAVPYSCAALLVGITLPHVTSRQPRAFA